MTARPARPSPAVIAVPISTADSAPATSTERARYAASARTPLSARPTRTRPRQAGIAREQDRLGRRDERQRQHRRERHRDVVVERRRQRLDERADRRERERGPDRARPVQRVGVEREPRDPRRQERRGGRAEDDEGDEPRPALASVPRQARAAGQLADEARHAVAHGQDPPARRRHPEAVAEEQDEGEHRERVGEDPDRIAARDVRRAPHPAAEEPRQHLPVEDEGGERHERGLRPRQPAQQQRERHARDVDDAPRELAARQAHEALPRASSCPAARSQRTVSRRPSASGRHA